MKSWIILLLIFAFQIGSCSAMAGGTEPWPAVLIALTLIVALKVWNDRSKVLGFPMEFLLFSTVIMIVVNLARLYILPLPY